MVFIIHLSQRRTVQQTSDSSVVCTTSRGHIQNTDDEIHMYQRLAVDGKYKKKCWSLSYARKI